MLERVRRVLDKENLKPIAAILTHGHLDHTFSIFPVSDHYQIPALIHQSDRALLTDPWRALRPDGELRALMTQLGVTDFAEPAEVQVVADGQKLEIAGMHLEMIHSPGHTKGSIMVQVDNEHLISGDTLFAGGIGRYDLPTSSPVAMLKTLKEKVLPLADELIVHPGHGGQTTIGRERKSNPYLREEFLNGKWS